MHACLPLLIESDFPAVRRGRLETLQVNLGYRCNQQCLHCHVNAGPSRKEMMNDEVLGQVLAFLENADVSELDLTGGAPELHPRFRGLVEFAAKQGMRIMDRCNLTILSEPGQEDLAKFLAQHRVMVVASLPCYQPDNVDAQRGKGVFERSIQGLRLLNELGYGRDGLELNLVYNPQGAVLPPPQQSLEEDYRKHLQEEYGIVFSQLFTLANMPIQRFGSTLISKGGFDDYMALLRSSFNGGNMAGLMCRSQISVDWQGYVYDCDFNQMLGLNLPAKAGAPVHISELEGKDLNGQPVRTADHCYACTAGQGSSCGGALSGASGE